MYQKLLELVEFKPKEVISREATLLIFMVGVPNVANAREDEACYCRPTPSVTQDIAGYKIAHQPSIYILETPGVLVPSIPNIETELKLAFAGSVKDSVVGEERIAQYLLAVLNTQGTPLHWKHLNSRRLEGIQYDSKEKHEYNLKDLWPKRTKPPNDSDMLYIELI
ncbi:hypothetical protein RGQ29_021697 [Quercus rubra]|uniref:Uncharacterized protein n=1 Tax=Quercus rubra TaxID=3512 RepID=A0AAN7INA0_QUERU|nr:hypothetical protein RGQ29_021697 [Quercus rubra]